jgi:phosphoenolpyruvate phosphomutase
MDTTQELIPADDFARKIESGKRAQRDTDFVVIARTEALISGYDVDEALTRAEIYTDAGADGVLVHSKQDSPREVLEFLHRWSRRSPVVVVPTTYYNWPAREAAAAGVSMVIYANHTLRAAISAMRAALSEIESSGCTSTLEPNISSVDELFDLVRLDEWLSLEQ